MSLKKFAFRFIAFNGIGICAFIIDIVLLTLLTEYFKVYYLTSAALAFIIATTFHYLVVRRIAFKSTSRPLAQGYAYFIIIAIINLILTILILKFSVEIIGLHYLIARPLVSVFIGLWNFIISTKLTFKTPLYHKTLMNLFLVLGLQLILRKL